MTEGENISKLIENILLEKLNIKEKVEVNFPKDPKHGDYSSNIILKIHSKYNLDKEYVFSLLKDNLKEYKIEEKSYFLNIFIKTETLKNVFIQKSIPKRKEKVLVEYSSPNIAKSFSIGHFSSTIIGDSIYRIYKYLGYDTTNDNHIGDWGVQFGKLIYAIKEWGDQEKINKNPIEELNLLYIKFHKEEEINPEITIKAKEYYKKLSEGDTELIEYWKKIVKWSMEEFNKTYTLLGISFENIKGESFYKDMAEDIVKKALTSKKAVIEDGAVVVYTDKNKKPLVIRKSDGTTLYSTHDLATIQYRAKELSLNTVIYEIGSEQTQAIKQMFDVAKKLELYDEGTQLILISHGFVKLPGGEKMSTRKGNTIKLTTLIDEAITKTRNMLSERSIDDEDTIKDIAIGAIKFNILKRHYSSDIIFEWDNILSFNGDNSVYIQYTYVRTLGILKNIDVDKNLIEFTNTEEEELVRMLYKFNDYVNLAKLSPNILSEYLLNISKMYNSIYAKYNILKEENNTTKNTLLLITLQTKDTIKQGLSLLGINTVDKM